MVRQSSVGSMDLCPARQGYLLSGEAKQVPSEAMSFGTMIHSFAEWRLEGNDGAVYAPQLRAWWEEGLERDGVKLSDLASKVRIRESLDEGLRACQRWDADVFPVLGLSDDYTIEEKLMAPLGMTPNGREVWLQGTADVVDLGNGRIIDWKTAARGWKESKAHATHQAQAYSFLVQAAHGVDVFDFSYWVWNRSKGEWSEHTTVRTADNVDAWLRHAWMRALQIEANAFPFTPWQSTYGDMKRGWWCSAKYCAAWSVCTGKSLPDDIWEDEPIDIKGSWQ